MMRAALAFLATSALLSAAPLGAAPVPSVRELRVGPIAETKTGMELVFAGPAAPCGERLKGSFSVFGSVLDMNSGTRYHKSRGSYGMQRNE